MSSSFRGAGFLPDGSIHGTECGNPHCKKHDTPIQKCYKCVKCQTYLHPPTLFLGSMETSCSMAYGDDGAIRCNEEIVGTPCYYKDEYRDHINRVMGNGKSNIPAAASLPNASAVTPATTTDAATPTTTTMNADDDVPKEMFCRHCGKQSCNCLSIPLSERPPKKFCTYCGLKGHASYSAKGAKRILIKQFLCHVFYVVKGHIFVALFVVWFYTKKQPTNIPKLLVVGISGILTRQTS